MRAKQIPNDFIQIAKDWGFMPGISGRRNCGGLKEKDQRYPEGYNFTLFLFGGYISLGSLGEFNYFFILILLFKKAFE